MNFTAVSKPLDPLDSDLPLVIVHVMRHATTKDLGRYGVGDDPDIVEKGRLQCQKFAKSFRNDTKFITAIFSSPMTRATSTAFLAFKDVVANGKQVIVLPELSRNKGQSGKELQRKYGKTVDVRRLQIELKDDPYLGSRFSALMKFFRWGALERPQMWRRVEVAVVVHGGCLPSGVTGTIFAAELPNAVLGSYKFYGQHQLEKIDAKEMDKIRERGYEREKMEDQKRAEEQLRIERMNYERLQADWKRIAEDEARKRKVAEDEARKKEIAEEEARKRKIAEDEAKKKKIAKDKAGKKKIAKEEAAKKKIAGDEARKKSIAEDEVWEKTVAVDEAKKGRRKSQKAQELDIQDGNKTRTTRGKQNAPVDPIPSTKVTSKRSREEDDSKSEYSVWGRGMSKRNRRK